MCRHLAYLGPPVTLASLLYDPPHGLVHQSWAPRDMRSGGTVNADGFGVGWAAGSGKVLRYRRNHPIWTDAFLPELARTTRVASAMAAVRAASSGMPLVEAACAPFTGGAGSSGDWLFSLNGRIAGWPGSVAGLAERLPVTDLLTMDAPVDSALLWALVRHRLTAGAGPGEALAGTVADVTTAAPGSRLNLLLAGPGVVAATVVTHALSIRAEPGRSVLVSSEPLDDDPAWRALPDGVLVVATTDRVEITELRGLP